METLQGKASDILLQVADGYYFRTFNEEGRMVLVCKDTQTVWLPSDEVLYYMEIIYGYELLQD
jgi:hypothetical protein